MAKLQQGYTFDSRYRLLRKLGEGGYSEVWLVEDTSVGMEQVLKIFLPSAQLDEAAVNLFREEFKLVYNINHPNLLKYSYFGVCVDYPYLLMPYYDRGSAESMIGKISESAAWRYLRDVASGLACLHTQRPAIIHQDIKPANVLLGSDGNFIITDFGISANIHSLFLGGRNGSVQGTRPYMPPEKFQYNPQILAENDIWSLGASLYELLTGNLPFGSGGGANQLNGTALPPRPGNISYNMWEVITKCLARYPEQRPTARELEYYAEKMLKPAIRPLIPTTPDPIPNPPSPSRNPLPWIIAAAGVAVVAIMVVLFSFLLSGNRAEKQSEDKAQVETPVNKGSSTTPTSKVPHGPKHDKPNDSGSDIIDPTDLPSAEVTSKNDNPPTTTTLPKNQLYDNQLKLKDN